MESVLVVVHLFLAIGLVGLILIQHGKGADMGAAFGAGASATVFGSRGAGNFLSRTTAVLATLFFVTSLALAYFAMQSTEPATLMEGVAPPAVEKAPAANEAAGDLPTVPETAAPPSDVPVVPPPSAVQIDAAPTEAVPAPQEAVPDVPAATEVQAADPQTPATDAAAPGTGN